MPNALVTLYVLNIQKGLYSVDKVPEHLREEVIKELEKQENGE